MSTLALWATPRLRTLRTIALGVATWPVAFAILWALWPATAAPAGTADRLAYGVQLAVAPALVLWLVLQGCWRILDTPQAEDPFVGAESRRWKINARVLGNTVEQGLMFAPVIVALSVRIAPEHVAALPILTLLWFVGRLMFWAGYHVALHWRAPGMDWTIASTTVALGWLGATYL